MRFPKNSIDRDLLYVRYEHFNNDGKRVISVNVVRKRGEDGAEGQYFNWPVNYVLINLDNGQSTPRQTAYTLQDGEVQLVTFNPETGIDNLIDSIGKSGRYKITVEANGLKEELEFDYE